MLVTNWTHRSRSGCSDRCSTASRGEPFDSYQSAARRWSLDMISGSCAAARRAGTRGTTRGSGTTLVDGRAGPRTGSRPRVSEAPVASPGLEDGIAEWARQLIEHGRPSQEPLQIVGQAGQGLAVEVIGDVAISPLTPPPRDRRSAITAAR